MNRAKKPFCADCKTTTGVHVVAQGQGSVWLCGSCEVLRADPNARRTEHPPGLPVTWPRRRTKQPQKEQLF